MKLGMSTPPQQRRSNHVRCFSVPRQPDALHDVSIRGQKLTNVSVINFVYTW